MTSRVRSFWTVPAHSSTRPSSMRSCAHWPLRPVSAAQTCQNGGHEHTLSGYRWARRPIGGGTMRGFGLTIEPLAGGAVRVALRGELDLEHAYTFDEELRRVEGERPSCLVLDLRGLSFLDSSG